MNDEPQQATRSPINVHVRGLDSRHYRTLQHMAINRGTTIGRLVNEAITMYLASQKEQDSNE